MPTYEYRCVDCDRTFELVQSFHDDPVTECPTCGGPVKKVFGNVGIVFKGSGFYKTDSRSGSTSGSRSDTASTGDGGGSTKTGEGGSSDKTPSSDGAPASPAPAPATPAAPKPSTSGSPSTT